MRERVPRTLCVRSGYPFAANRRTSYMEEKNGAYKAPPRKLCLNCAWRAACGKRFSVSVVNGEVRCLEYSYDLTLKEK